MTGTTLLVVEDDAFLRDMLGQMLEDLGYRVERVGQGAEALALLEREPAIRLLLTDIRMPGLGGYELADRALALRPGLRVIYVSGYAQAGHPQDLPLSGPILHKPYSAQQLRQAVEQALAG